MAGATTLLQESPTRAPEIAGSGSGNRLRWQEVAVAVAGFAALCVLVLTKTSAMLEPDDYAYQASIVALSHGQVVLSTAQYHALSRALGDGGTSIPQWVHLPDGRWISQKNPGYPFLAVLFYLAGVLRLAPLFYGALGAFGLYHGARAWLGRGAGAYAVWLFSFSGAALVFAWRSTMPSFTDASLIAAGAGGLVWALVSVEARRRRRRTVGLLSFLALEAAVFVRYTNVVELVVAVAAVVVFARAARLDRATLATWLASAALFGLGVAAFNEWAYGHATSTGYSAGEISFAWSAFLPNLKTLPRALAEAMPVWLLAAAGVVAIAVRWWRHRASTDPQRADARRDVAVASSLAVGWLGLWLWYLTYTWTAQMGGGGGGGDIVHLIRFYLPVIGPIALLGAWVLSRTLRAISWTVVGILVAAALVSFYSMAGATGPGGVPGGGPGGGFGTGRGPALHVGGARPAGPARGGAPGSSGGPPSPP